MDKRRAYDERQRQRGRRVLSTFIDEGSLATLDMLKIRLGLSDRGEAIEWLIRNKEERATART